eukprot:scaffold6397_cov175-Ochromonas_danica.AAC.2
MSLSLSRLLGQTQLSGSLCIWLAGFLDPSRNKGTQSIMMRQQLAVQREALIRGKKEVLFDYLLSIESHCKLMSTFPLVGVGVVFGVWMALTTSTSTSLKDAARSGCAGARRGSSSSTLSPFSYALQSQSIAFHCFEHPLKNSFLLRFQLLLLLLLLL